jgi:hypothetical protein
MRKHAYFDTYWDEGWPSLNWLKPYFIALPEKRWAFSGGNDSAGFDAEGIDDTEHLEFGKGRIDIRLSLWGNRRYGVFLLWEKVGGGFQEIYSSKGDLTRLGELMRSLHDTPLPVGLFVPFEDAWKAVKEFIEKDGQRPKSIEWIANSDLPPNTFPDP